MAPKRESGRGGILIERGLIKFFPLKRGGLLEGGGLFEEGGGGEGGGFIEDTVIKIKTLTKYKLYELVKTMVRMSSFFIFHSYLF